MPASWSPTAKAARASAATCWREGGRDRPGGGDSYRRRDAGGRPCASSALISHLCRYPRARRIPRRPAATSGGKLAGGPGGGLSDTKWVSIDREFPMTADSSHCKELSGRHGERMAK